ncbi:bifunctional phosphoribosylaminoimidazolecarboxamide formyltransferase/IMP cyclohydrolase [candidate division KSB1 bacterium]
MGNTQSAVKVARALLSVSDKSGLESFARGLAEAGVEILSSGGTSRELAGAGIPHLKVDDYTGSPEILDGRVKTLHPRIHGGILARRDIPAHLEQLAANDIQPIDLVAVNLYPFAATISKADVTMADAIENIDIGGPTLVRASAKNHEHVCIVTDPSDYQAVLEEMRTAGSVSRGTRERLAVKAFTHTAEYDDMIQEYLARNLIEEERITLRYRHGRSLRYGENWHQKASFFTADNATAEATIAAGEQLHGKELSYNNILDAAEALEAIKSLAPDPAVAVIKHSNPCGYATGESLAEALEYAWAGDPVSAFGSVIALTRTVDEPTALFLKGKFVEMLIAPDFSPEALEYFRAKKKDLRLIKVAELSEPSPELARICRPILGGLLVQDRDLEDAEKFECVTRAKFPENLMAAARFGYKAVKHVKSNAITLAYEYKPGCFMQLGMGAGQPNRIDALVKLAVPRALDNAKALAESKPGWPESDELMAQVVLASDAFFPFDDAVRAAAEFGIRYVVQPGGSMRDEEVIAACDELGLAMLFTGTRHFKH